jgi:hypothetical protein
LGGEYHETAPKDPWFAGITAIDLPPIPGDMPKAAATGPTLGSVAKQFFDFKSKNDWAAKTAADVKRVVTLATELIGADKSMTSVDIDDVKCVRNALASIPPNYMKMGANKGVRVKEAILANQSGFSLSVKTQDKYFTMFKQILIWAANEGYLDKVPGANVKLDSRKSFQANSAIPILQINSSRLLSHRSTPVRCPKGAAISPDRFLFEMAIFGCP